MAFDVVADAFDTTNNAVPAVLNPTHPAMPVTGGATRSGPDDEFVRAERPVDDQRPDLGRRRRQSDFTTVLAEPRTTSRSGSCDNDSGGWYHPSTSTSSTSRSSAATGGPARRTRSGPKDVVFLGEGETVRLLIKFDRTAGKYMMHCHNLVHEDHDMMFQYRVLGPGPDTPADPDPRLDPTPPPV